MRHVSQTPATAHHWVRTQRQGRRGLGFEARRGGRPLCLGGARLPRSTSRPRVARVPMRSIVDPSSMQSPNQARERDTRVIIDKLDLLSRDAHFIIGQMAGNVPLIVAAGRWPGPARLWPTSTQAAHRKRMRLKSQRGNAALPPKSRRVSSSSILASQGAARLTNNESPTTRSRTSRAA
jgi:hypothetical protein